MLYIAADHRGFVHKNQIKDYLIKKSIEFEDLGALELDQDDDYPDFAFKLGEKVVSTNSKGILICGSGIGVTVAANKVKGARAGYVESLEHARKAREDDDTNILVLDSLTFDPKKDFEIIDTWLNTSFSGEERHKRRLSKIELYEKNK